MANDDCIRKTLITRFYCTECGQQLKISYGDKMLNKNDYNEADPKTSGGYVVENKIFVYPCNCQKKSIEDLIREVAKNDPAN